MVTRIHILILVCTAMLLTGAAVAASQSGDSGQTDKTQQQSAQSQSDQKKTDQKKSDQQQSDQQQSDQNQTQNSSKQSSGQEQSSAETHETVGEAGQSYLLGAQMPSQVLATNLIGLTIRNKADKIGTVSDVILNKDYKLVGFVVDMSGITGTIQKSVGIARGAVKKIDPEKGVIIVTVKKDQLQSVRNYATQKDLNEHNNLQ